MRGILIFLLAIGLLFLSATAEGADWELVTVSKGNGDLWYVDKESIRHVSKTVVRAWYKDVLINPSPFNSKEIDELFIYKETNCIERKSSFLQIKHTYSDGTSESFMPPMEWRYIRPDTIESIIFNYLCKDKK